jgi:hypothetical protein
MTSPVLVPLVQGRILASVLPSLAGDHNQTLFQDERTEVEVEVKSQGMLAWEKIRCWCWCWCC